MSNNIVDFSKDTPEKGNESEGLLAELQYLTKQSAIILPEIEKEDADRFIKQISELTKELAKRGKTEMNALDLRGSYVRLESKYPMKYNKDDLKNFTAEKLSGVDKLVYDYCQKEGLNPQIIFSSLVAPHIRISW